ncbi:MAG: GatB/YqeY domain-containing protein [Chloroflexi bacterium]|nr:GatB/YqeY domain-containing protein [Chloroflexota bacterium]
MQTLKEQLTDQIKTSLRGGDKLKCTVIRSLMAAVKNAEIAQQKELDDNAVTAVVIKLVKQHHESIEAFKQGNRPELVAQEEAELAILNVYMPEQMSRAEIEGFAKKAIAEAGATGPHEKGKVMGRLMPQLKGKADGNLINTVVTELLSQ